MGGVFVTGYECVCVGGGGGCLLFLFCLFYMCFVVVCCCCCFVFRDNGRFSFDFSSC